MGILALGMSDSDFVRCLVVFSALFRVLLRSLDLKSLYSIVLPVVRYLQICRHSARLSAVQTACSAGRLNKDTSLSIF